MLGGLLLSTLICLLGAPDEPQQPARATFFSGSVLSVSDIQITVRRRALVSNATTQTFVIDSETKIEGNLRVKANVTVRYIVDEEGHTKAVSIIVR
jgi:hypothetical protein